MKRHICATVLLFGFLLGTHNGYVALYSDGKTDPDRIYPYRVSSLPPADQEALRKGIPAKDILELTELLQDYLS